MVLSDEFYIWIAEFAESHAISQVAESSLLTLQCGFLLGAHAYKCKCMNYFVYVK